VHNRGNYPHSRAEEGEAEQREGGRLEEQTRGGRGGKARTEAVTEPLAGGSGGDWGGDG